MYKVKCDEHLLYSDSIDKYSIGSPKLELELNKAGKFTFTVYKNHPCYGLIRKMKSIITVYQDNELIFRGRVLESELGWYNEQKITCEGELAFLNDSIIEPYDYMTGGQITIAELFTKFITEHNAQVDEYKKFEIGEITVTDGDTSNTDNKISRSSEDYDTTWSSINKKLLEPLGGYLVIRHEDDRNYIDYLADINVTTSQPIKFGINMTDVTQKISGDEVITAIIPLGAKDEESGLRLTIEDATENVNKVKYLINQDQAEQFGLIFKTVVWDDVHEADILWNKAKSYLTSIGFLTNTIEINAIDISMIDSKFNPFKLGMKILVNSDFHKIESTMMIEKLSIDLMKPESNKITLGTTVKSFTEQTSSSSSAIESISQKVNSAEQSIINLDSSVTSRVSAEINLSVDGLMQTIEESYYSKGATDTLFKQTKTEFEQTTDEFDFRFQQYEADLKETQEGSDSQFKEIRKYIRFSDGNIILGEEGNELTLKIQNDRISFLENDIEVAYISNKKLFITDATFINSMNIGNFGFFPRDNGNLSLKKVGE